MRSASGLQLAKRLVEPTWCTHPTWVETAGPEVGELAASAGMAPDPEQQMILDITFGFRSDGKSAAFEIDIIGPRQNIKTSTVIMIELGWLYVTRSRLIIHSAHKLSASAEAFRDTRKLIEQTPHLAKRLDPRIGRADSRGITEAATMWGIHLVDDRRLLYSARAKDAGRSLAGDKVVLDEGFALTQAMMGDLLPTLSSRPDPQVVIASSAGKLESAVLRKARDQGRAGLADRQAYIEYGDLMAGKGCKLDHCSHIYGVKGCALDDEGRWAAIMPALGRRVTVETVRSMRQSMPPAEFAREFMVWWEDPPNGDVELVLNMKRWAKLRNKNAPKPAEAVLVLDVAPDRSEASIGVGARGSDDRTLVITYTKPGTGWVAKKVRDLTRAHEITEVALNPAGQASVLMVPLDKLGIPYSTITTREVGQACGWFIDAVNKGSHPLEHVGQKELAGDVATAITRHTGEVEIWDRRDGRPITALTAGSTAAHRWSLRHNYDVLDSVH